MALFDFSGDEAFALFASGVISVAGVVQYYLPLISIPMLGRSAIGRTVLAVLPPIILALTAAVLNRWADPQVVGHADYILLFLIVGAAWLTIAVQVLSVFGISIRDDVIDRGNRAALIAGCGGLIGVSTIYALANVGGGPTIWTTIGPAGVGTAALFSIGFLAEVAGNITEAIAIDRDIASGVRSAGAWIGCGLVLGRSVGGVWVSTDRMWQDFARFGWPAIFIGLAAGITNRAMKPTAAHPQRDPILFGLIPAGAFLLIAIVALSFTPHAFEPSQW